MLMKLAKGLKRRKIKYTSKSFSEKRKKTEIQIEAIQERFKVKMRENQSNKRRTFVRFERLEEDSPISKRKKLDAEVNRVAVLQNLDDEKNRGAEPQSLDTEVKKVDILQQINAVQNRGSDLQKLNGEKKRDAVFQNLDAEKNRGDELQSLDAEKNRVAVIQSLDAEVNKDVIHRYLDAKESRGAVLQNLDAEENRGADPQNLDGEVKRIAVLKQSGGGVIPLNKDVISERTRQYNPDMMDIHKTTVFPALPESTYVGPIDMHITGIPASTSKDQVSIQSTFYVRLFLYESA
jgi:hypothetical protein